MTILDNPAKDVFGRFFQELNKQIEANDGKLFANSLLKIKETGYFGYAIFAASELNEAFNEMEQVLKGLEGRDYLIFKAFRLEDLVLIHKMYFIMWGTIVDLYAKLINVIFDFGIDERDVKLETILRNKHIKKTELASIVNEYKQKDDYTKSAKTRNDIVHRNKIGDDDIQKMLTRKNTLVSSRYSILSENKISDQEYEVGMAEINKDVQALFGSKKIEYATHKDSLMETILRAMPLLAEAFYRQAIRKAAI